MAYLRVSLLEHPKRTPFWLNNQSATLDSGIRERRSFVSSPAVIPRRVAHSAFVFLPLLVAACSSGNKQSGAPAVPDEARTAPAVGADAGLEVTTFLSDVHQHALAVALAPYADQPLPISHELEDLWTAHGLRMVSLPIDDAASIVSKLQTGGGSQRQWLGQAYAWTEAARGSEFGSGRIIALDAERIRLSAGALRLLVRSWVEPVPPEPRVGIVSGEGGGPGDVSAAILRVEMVPQHRELRPDTSRENPLSIREPKIDAETQGLLFSRLYARMSVPAGRAVLILAERPGANWRRIALQPDPSLLPIATPEERRATTPSPTDNPWPKRGTGGSASPAATHEWSKVRPKGESSPGTEPPAPAPVKSGKVTSPPASGAPRLGEVIRGPIAAPTPPSANSTQDAELDAGPGESGPSSSRVATLGEALLNQFPSNEDPRGNARPAVATQRTIILLIPRVPREFHLLGPMQSPAPGRTGASPPRE